MNTVAVGLVRSPKCLYYLAQFGEEEWIALAGSNHGVRSKKHLAEQVANALWKQNPTYAQRCCREKNVSKVLSYNALKCEEFCGVKKPVRYINSDMQEEFSNLVLDCLRRHYSHKRNKIIKEVNKRNR